MAFAYCVCSAYDTDLDLYYLNSRYYDPNTGRFINADTIDYLDPESINGLNLYAYCLNNPVMYVDPSGHFGIAALVAITLTAALAGGTAQLISNALAGLSGPELWTGVIGASLGAGVDAMLLCLTMPLGAASYFIAAAVGSMIQTSTDLIESSIRGEDIDLLQTLGSFGVNFATMAAGNIIGAKLIPTNAGWFQPKKFMSVFTKSYGQKILLQAGLGSVFSGVVNFGLKYDFEKSLTQTNIGGMPVFI